MSKIPQDLLNEIYIKTDDKTVVCKECGVNLGRPHKKNCTLGWLLWADNEIDTLNAFNNEVMRI